MIWSKKGWHERGVLLKNAPHLSHPIAFVTPLYRWIDVPQVFAGLKLYDILSGKWNIGHSKFLSRKEILKRFPSVKAKGLKAGVLYYDGQFNDARMAVALSMTAEKHGAVIGNHIEVTSLNKTNDKISSVSVKDKISGEEWQIKAKGTINANWPIWRQSPVRWMIRTSSRLFQPVLVFTWSSINALLHRKTGLMIPKTEDGRVLFVLPWQGHALIGTTDDPAEITEHPKTHRRRN